MAELPAVGKIPPEIFETLFYPNLGAQNDSIIVGPQHGVDVGIVEIGNKAVSITTDPFSLHPEIGFEKAAWFALHIIVSDSITSGLKPTYLSIDLNLPLEMNRQQLETVWKAVHAECARLGIAVIAGHTAKYANCHYTMVGGATIIGIGEKDEYLTPALARAGDKIIITKGPAIQTTGLFAVAMPETIERKFGSGLTLKAQSLFPKMSVVPDASIAIAAGIRENGVVALHDATECGIIGAVYEMGQSSGLGVRLDKDNIIVAPGVKEICGYFGLDPYSSISEGTLVIACRPHRAEVILAALNGAGIEASVAGELTEPAKGMMLVENGQAKELRHPGTDKFWTVYYDALKKYQAEK